MNKLLSSKITVDFDLYELYVLCNMLQERPMQVDSTLEDKTNEAFIGYIKNIFKSVEHLNLGVVEDEFESDFGFVIEDRYVPISVKTTDTGDHILVGDNKKKFHADLYQAILRNQYMIESYTLIHECNFSPYRKICTDLGNVALLIRTKSRNAYIVVYFCVPDLNSYIF